MTERFLREERQRLRNEAAVLVEDASKVVVGLGYEPLTSEEQKTYAKKLYAYIQQQKTHRKSRLPNLEPVEVACGILELRNTPNLIKRFMQPFARTLIESRAKALEYAHRIPARECLSRDGNFECVHLHHEEALLNAGVTMRNCLRKAPDREKRLLEDEHGERLYAVYAIQNTRPLTIKKTGGDDSEAHFHSIFQIDVEHQVVVDLEGAYNSYLKPNGPESQATIEALMHLRDVYHPHLSIPPQYFRQWNLRPNELLIFRDRDAQIVRMSISDPPAYEPYEVITGRIDAASVTRDELQRALRLPVLIDLSSATSAIRESLSEVRGGIEDRQMSQYPNLTSVAYVIVPKIGIGPHLPHMRNAPVTIPTFQ